MNTPAQPVSNREVARVVAELLEAAGISQKRASEETGIPRATLLRRLNGSSFQIDELRALADLLDVSISEIVSRAEKAVA